MKTTITNRITSVVITPINSICSLLVLVSSFCLADTAKVESASLITSPPTPQELASLLFPQNSDEESVEASTRNLDLRGIAGIRKSRKKTNHSTASKIEVPPRSVNMAIQFEFASATLQRGSHAMIDAIANMLSMKSMQDSAIYIEGHTDSVGDARSNRRLSLRRASAVKEYLVHRHGISPDRLHVNGKGESSPLIPARPNASANRRVEIKPL